MSQLLHLATAADLERTERMVATWHGSRGIAGDEADRRAALLPLLEGSPHGAVWLVGPKMAPVGYIVVSFGWSIELGGLSGAIEEFWIRDAVRRRGMGTEALSTLLKALKEAGVVALSADVEQDNDTALRLCARAGFAPQDSQKMAWRA